MIIGRDVPEMRRQYVLRKNWISRNCCCFYQQFKIKEVQRKNEWTPKRMHGLFARDMEDKDKNNTRRWMRKSNLEGCTKALISSAQEQSIRTNYIKNNIDKTAESPLCMMCGTGNETISHIVSKCGELAQKESKRRHDSVGRHVQWQFCEKLGFNRQDFGMNINQKV